MSCSSDMDWWSTCPVTKICDRPVCQTNHPKYCTPLDHAGGSWCYSIDGTSQKHCVGTIEPSGYYLGERYHQNLEHQTGYWVDRDLSCEVHRTESMRWNTERELEAMMHGIAVLNPGIALGC